MRSLVKVVGLAAVLGVPAAAIGQETAANPPEVGAMAPDFEIRGATRYGLLRDGVKLSDFRGQTVVLAFFARVRTRG